MKLKKWLSIGVFIVAAIAIPGLFSSREVETRIEINAAPGKVWAVLTDFQRYGAWNPFITRISGTATADTPLAVTIKPAIGGAMDFKLRLKSLKESQEMIWTGQTLMPRLLDGEHYFRIEVISADKVLFSQGERYSGLLLFFSWPVINWSVKQSFNDMNQALKGRAEAASR